MKLAAILLLIVGGFLCCTNFYLSFLRYPVHRLMGRAKDEYRWVSGIPLIGSAFVALSLIYFWSQPTVVLIAVVMILIDTGGIHWFAGSMIYQKMMKDNKCVQHEPSSNP